MSINIDRIIKLNNLDTNLSRRKRTIVLDPEGEYDGIENYEKSIAFEYDTDIWEIPEEIQDFVDQLIQNTKLSNEDKILKVYEKLCMTYVYDDNLISYLKQNADGSFSHGDWNGKNPSEEWKRNRKVHNRRVCYELSRNLAKILIELFKDNENYDVTILWDKPLTHYFVALSCDDYSITLDLDDFNNIKDLTRVKAGLTAEGIKILEDKKGKFNGALDRFNEGRSKDAVKKIEHDIVYYDYINNLIEMEQIPDDIISLTLAIRVLAEKHNIESQGLYEYIKEIIDVKLGPQAREKVCKKINGQTIKENRIIRCLSVNIDGQNYLIDVDEGIIRLFDSSELNDENSPFLSYKGVHNDDVIDYRSQPETRYNGG